MSDLSALPPHRFARFVGSAPRLVAECACRYQTHAAATEARATELLNDHITYLTRVGLNEPGESV